MLVYTVEQTTEAEVYSDLPVSTTGAEVSIIEDELQDYKCNIVEDIKNIKDFKDGDFVITNGFYESGDGGGARYQIIFDSKLKEDGCTIFKIDEEAFAVLAPEDDTIRPEQFGIKFDGNDESDKLKKLFTFKDGMTIIFPDNKELLVSKLFLIENNNLTIEGNSSTIKMMDDSGIFMDQVVNKKYFFMNHCPGIINVYGDNNKIENLIIDYNYQNNMYTDSNGRQWAKLTSYTDATLCPDEFKNKAGGICCIEVTGNENILDGLVCKNGTWGNIHITGMNQGEEYKRAKNNIVRNCTTTCTFQDSIYVNGTDGTIIENNIVYDTYFHGIHVYNANKNVTVKDNDCYFTNNYKNVISPYPDFVPEPHPLIVVSHDNYPQSETRNIIVENNYCHNYNDIDNFKDNVNCTGIFIESGFPRDVNVKNNHVDNLRKGIEVPVFQYGINTIKNNYIENCIYAIHIRAGLSRSMLNTDISKGGTYNGLPSFTDKLPNCTINIADNDFEKCSGGGIIITESGANKDLNFSEYTSGFIINFYKNNYIETPDISKTFQFDKDMIKISHELIETEISADEEESNPEESHEGNPNPDESHEENPNPDESHEGNPNPDESHEENPNPDESHEENPNPDESHEENPNPDESHEGNLNPDESHEGNPNPDESHKEDSNPDKSHSNTSSSHRSHISKSDVDDKSTTNSRASDEILQKVGWQLIDGGFYYILSDGSYAKGIFIDPETEKKYMLDEQTGKMIVGWVTYNSKWYHFGDDGLMDIGWFRDKNGDWYYLSESGEMQTGWIKKDSKWYHLGDNGVMNVGWFKDKNGDWYYLSESGEMQTGWIKKDSKWYHLGDNGAMNIGWFKDINGNWYYLKSDGSMAYNEYIDGYYLNYSGVWNS